MSNPAVYFACSPQVAFDYFSDPVRRPEWQSSLRAVIDLTPRDDADAPDLARARWIDVTWPGLRPRMETTIYEPYERWAEAGVWRGFRAVLELRFAPSGTGTEVSAYAELDGARWLSPATWLAGRLAPSVVRADLRKAADRLKLNPD